MATDIAQQPTDQTKDTNDTTTAETPETPSFDVLHPLEHKWTLYFDAPKGRSNQTNWLDNVKPLITLETVEEFWG